MFPQILGLLAEGFENQQMSKGERNRFVGEAVREKLRRETLLSALEETAGVIAAEEHPEWTTREQVASWVRESRQQSDDRPEGLRRG